MSENSSPKRSCVLLVEDSPTQRARLAEILHSGDLDVIEAEDGLQGLREAKRARPDIVITDLEMPGLNGLAFAKALRSDASFSHVPIVMLTGHDQKDFRVNAFGLGVDDFITKPGEPDEVLARVASLLRLRKALSMVEEKNETLNKAMEHLRLGHKKAVAAQRLAYAGHLAAGIAHECNNPLAMLKANLSTLTDYAMELAELFPEELKSSDEVEEILDDLPEVAKECHTAMDRLQTTIGAFASLQDERATQESDTTLVPISPLLREAADAVKVGIPEAMLMFDPRMSESLQVRAASGDLKRYLVAFISYMYRVLVQEVKNSALILRVDVGLTEVQVCIDAPELQLTPAEAEEQFTRWLVAKDGRVSFDVNLGSAREGLLAMGAIVEHLAIYGGGWSLVLTFERQPDLEENPLGTSSAA